MKPRKIPSIAFLMALIISLLFVTSITFGQTGGGTTGGLGKSPQAAEFDKNALEKLKGMTPEEVEELDKKLAQAMTLFYDSDFARAMPIFREISDRVETMDIMFWYASSAAGAGESDLAIKKFRDMLEIDPNLHRVRLELATVYFGLGRFKDAQQELETVLEAKPPETVEKNIEKLLAAIEAKTKRLFTHARVSLGIQRDRNVSAGPDREFVFIPAGGGTIGPLTTTQKALRDWVTVGSFTGNVLYDIAGERGWMWNTSGSFYQTHNVKFHQFDFTQWSLTSGPWWAGRRSILKMPVGYAGNIFEHESLFKTIDFSPSYEYFFTPNFSLKGLFSYERDNYRFSAIPADDKTGQDNINRTWEINPNFYFNNRRDILSFYITAENSNAKVRRWTYSAINYAVSYFKPFRLFNGDMEFYGRFKFTKKDYATPALIWPPAHLRRDKRYNVYAVLSRNFSKNCFASFSYNWIDNESNTDLYDFDKYIYAFNVGYKF